MPERKILLGISGVVILLSFGAVGYLAVMGMLLKLDGLSLALISLLIAAVFATASAPELFSLFPLPPAVDQTVHYDAHSAGVPLFMKVWGGLLILTMIEVVLAYLNLSVIFMLSVLMGLSIIKAALIIAYFMHLRFERLSLVLTLMPALVMCILLLGIFFPDGARMRKMGQDRQMLGPPAAAEGTEPPH
jgi:cytochrome c oxidase subunit 4